MSIPAKRIGRVIVAGEWFTVALNSFEVVDMEFTDESGNPIHDTPIGTKAYRFTNELGNVYYGPLSEIKLFKLIDV